jgi:hypothetical protein
MAESAPPWERQPREGQAAFAAFVIYRDLPAESRSLAATARRLRAAGNNGRGERTLERLESLSVRWQWALRAKAWDAEVQRRRRDADKLARRDMADRHARQAVVLQQKLLTRLQKLNPEELEPADLVRWLEVAVKVERLSREDANPATEVLSLPDAAAGRMLTQAILNDPVASKLACRLLDRIAKVSARDTRRPRRRRKGEKAKRRRLEK